MIGQCRVFAVSQRPRTRCRHLFVHDLVTAEAARGGGHGAALIRWLEAEARSHGCSRCRRGSCGCAACCARPPHQRGVNGALGGRRLVLDSNTERGQAHRFYHAHGLTIRSFHFAKDLA